MERLKELQDIKNYIEYKKAEDNLQEVIGETILKYAIPGINYMELWNFEFRIREFMKDFGGF